MKSPRVSILACLALALAGAGCTYHLVSLQELLDMDDSDSFRWIEYHGSDAEYNYFVHARPLAPDRGYKFRRSEFPLREYHKKGERNPFLLLQEILDVDWGKLRDKPK